MSTVRETFGLACPTCHRDDGIIVLTTEYVRLVPDGTLSAGDQEWALDSAAHCVHCGETGIVAEFDPDKEDVPLAVTPAASRRPSFLTTDVLCELAHALTVRECAVRQIPLDAYDGTEDETNYTEEARPVFDAIYDIVSDVLDPYREEVAS